MYYSKLAEFIVVQWIHLITRVKSIIRHFTSSFQALMEQVSAFFSSSLGDDDIISTGRHSDAPPNLVSLAPISKSSKTKVKAKALIEREVWTFMRSLMDEFTHLGNFSPPCDTDLVIVIAAMKDAYIPKRGVVSPDKLWPGIETRYLNNGHISSFLFKQNAFR